MQTQMNFAKWFGLFILLFLTMGAFAYMKKQTVDSQIRVGLPGAWNTLHPGLQHTLFGDLVLSNQFEALVGVNDSGVSIPLGAKRWEISDDFRVFRFYIDTVRTFSDGSHLTARDFKRSWEVAAKLQPISANNSLLDVLYKIEGFEAFQTKGTISGLAALNDDILEIRFASPFRQALEYLQGNRFAAYKDVDGKPVGTGIFVISEVEQNHVILKPRVDLGFANLPTLDVRYFPTDEIAEKLLKGEIDAIHYMSGHTADAALLFDSSIETIFAQSSINLSLSLNGNTNSLFSKRSNRRALQFLVLETLKKERTLLPQEPYFESDFQFFLPFQAGRLDEPEVRSFIEAGATDVANLIAESKKKPIVAKASSSTKHVLELLKAAGLHLSSDSGTMPAKEFVALSYQSDGPDILVDAFSVASGDPDGIYHVLGKNGAIRTPYIYSEAVNELLEEGRKIVDVGSLDEHYKKVSRALLTEVPMVHLGFARALTAFRKDRVEIDAKVLRRNQGQLHFMRAKQ